jgi:hypothetical protein
MRTFTSKVATFALSFALLGTSVTASQAAMSLPLPAQSARADVFEIQARRDREEWRRNGFHRRGNDAYYNGHRGYRERRSGYREYNGVWFPLAAFSTGALIGGAFTADRPVRYGGNHAEWCSNRYRSFRAYDNTYQPNTGPRRECVSP